MLVTQQHCNNFKPGTGTKLTQLPLRLLEFVYSYKESTVTISGVLILWQTYRHISCSRCSLFIFHPCRKCSTVHKASDICCQKSPYPLLTNAVDITCFNYGTNSLAVICHDIVPNNLDFLPHISVTGDDFSENRVCMQGASQNFLVT